MLKAILVEDEESNCLYLQRIIEKRCPEISVLAHAANVENAYMEIVRHQPDIVFLDIEMKSESGFELLRRFTEIHFEVIFTTAYEHYALKAIKFSALDYLLKPIDENELVEAVKKVNIKRIQNNLNNNLAVLMNNLGTKEIKKQQIAISTQESLTYVRVSEIIYCQADGPYTYFFLKNGDKLVASKTLKEFEELLQHHRFFRGHNSYLINLDEVKKYLRGDGGELVMSNGKTVNVSKRKKEELLKLLSGI